MEDGIVPLFIEGRRPDLAEAMPTCSAT